MPQFTTTLPNAEHVNIPSSAVPLTSVGEGLSRAGGAIRDFRSAQLQERLKGQLEPLESDLVGAERLAREKSNIEKSIASELAIGNSKEVANLKATLQSLQARSEQFGDVSRFRREAENAARSAIRNNPGFGPELRQVYNEFIGNDLVRESIGSIQSIESEAEKAREAQEKQRNAIINDSVGILRSAGILNAQSLAEVYSNPIATLQKYHEPIEAYQRSEQAKNTLALFNAESELSKQQQEDLLPTLVASDVMMFDSNFGRLAGIDLYNVDPSTLDAETKNKLLVNLESYKENMIQKYIELAPKVGVDRFNSTVRDRIENRANNLKRYLNGEISLEILENSNKLVTEKVVARVNNTYAGQALNLIKAFRLESSPDPNIRTLFQEVSNHLLPEFRRMFDQQNPITFTRNFNPEDQKEARDAFFKGMKGDFLAYQKNKDPEYAKLIVNYVHNTSVDALNSPGAFTIQDYQNMFDALKTPEAKEVLNTDPALKSEIIQNLTRGATNYTERQFNGISRRLHDFFKNVATPAGPRAQQLGDINLSQPKVTLDFESPVIKFVPVDSSDKDSIRMANNLNREFDFNQMITAFSNITGISQEEAKDVFVNTHLRNINSDILEQLSINLPKMKLEDSFPKSFSGDALKLNKKARQYLPVLQDIAERVGVDPGIYAALIQQESGFNTKAESNTGVRGIAQLTLGTARELGVNREDPIQALNGGARYLKQMLDRYGDYTLAVAAYNSGPGALDSYLKEDTKIGNIASGQTFTYVQKILGESLDKAKKRWLEATGRLNETGERLGNTAKEVTKNAVETVGEARETVSDVVESIGETRESVTETAQEIVGNAVDQVSSSRQRVSERRSPETSLEVPILTERAKSASEGALILVERARQSAIEAVSIGIEATLSEAPGDIKTVGNIVSAIGRSIKEATSSGKGEVLKNVGQDIIGSWVDAYEIAVDQTSIAIEKAVEASGNVNKDIRNSINNLKALGKLLNIELRNAKDRISEDLISGFNNARKELDSLLTNLADKENKDGPK